MCWCTSASPNGMQRISQPARSARSSNERYPPLSRMQIIWVFIAPVPEEKDEFPTNANDISDCGGYFLKWLYTRVHRARCRVSGFTQMQLVIIWGVSLSLLELRRCRRAPSLPRRAGNVMDYKLLQSSPRNRPGRSYEILPRDFDRASPLSRGSTWIRLYDVWRNVTLRTLCRATVSLVASHILQVLNTPSFLARSYKMSARA